MGAPRRLGRFELLRALSQRKATEVWIAAEPTPAGAPGDPPADGADAGRRVVVLKVLRGVAPGSTALRRLEREVAALRGVRHAGVVEVLSDVVPLGPGVFGFTMRRIEGVDLEWLTGEGGARLTSREAAAAGYLLLDALEAVHEAGIVHRDVKPGNLVLGPRGALVLIDFGIARAATDLTITVGAGPKTLRYMSPEQAHGGPSRGLDARTDLYSAATVVYRLTAGKPPFGADDPEDLAREIIEATPPEIPGLAEPFAAWLRRGLAKDPAARFPSARGMREDLVATGIVPDDPFAARAVLARLAPPDGASPGLRTEEDAPPRRPRAWIGGLAVGAAVLAALVVIWAGRGGAARDALPRAPATELAAAAAIADDAARLAAGAPEALADLAVRALDSPSSTAGAIAAARLVHRAAAAGGGAGAGLLLAFGGAAMPDGPASVTLRALARAHVELARAEVERAAIEAAIDAEGPPPAPEAIAAALARARRSLVAVGRCVAEAAPDATGADGGAAALGLAEAALRLDRSIARAGVPRILDIEAATCGFAADPLARPGEDSSLLVLADRKGRTMAWRPALAAPVPLVIVGLDASRWGVQHLGRAVDLDRAGVARDILAVLLPAEQGPAALAAIRIEADPPAPAGVRARLLFQSDALGGIWPQALDAIDLGGPGEPPAIVAGVRYGHDPVERRVHFFRRAGSGDPPGGPLYLRDEALALGLNLEPHSDVQVVRRAGPGALWIARSKWSAYDVRRYERRQGPAGPRWEVDWRALAPEGLDPAVPPGVPLLALFASGDALPADGGRAGLVLVSEADSANETVFGAGRVAGPPAFLGGIGCGAPGEPPAWLGPVRKLGTGRVPVDDSGVGLARVLVGRLGPAGEPRVLLATSLTSPRRLQLEIAPPDRLGEPESLQVFPGHPIADPPASAGRLAPDTLAAQWIVFRRRLRVYGLDPAPGPAPEAPEPATAPRPRAERAGAIAGLLEAIGEPIEAARFLSTAARTGDDGALHERRLALVDAVGSPGEGTVGPFSVEDAVEAAQAAARAADRRPAGPELAARLAELAVRRLRAGDAGGAEADAARALSIARAERRALAVLGDAGRLGGPPEPVPLVGVLRSNAPTPLLEVSRVGGRDVLAFNVVQDLGAEAAVPLASDAGAIAFEAVIRLSRLEWDAAVWLTLRRRTAAGRSDEVGVAISAGNSLRETRLAVTAIARGPSARARVLRSAYLPLRTPTVAPAIRISIEVFGRLGEARVRALDESGNRGACLADALVEGLAPAGEEAGGSTELVFTSSPEPYLARNLWLAAGELRSASVVRPAAARPAAPPPPPDQAATALGRAIAAIGREPGRPLDPRGLETALADLAVELAADERRYLEVRCLARVNPHLYAPLVDLVPPALRADDLLFLLDIPETEVVAEADARAVAASARRALLAAAGPSPAAQAAAEVRWRAALAAWLERRGTPQAALDAHREVVDRVALAPPGDPAPSMWQPLLSLFRQAVRARDHGLARSTLRRLLDPDATHGGDPYSIRDRIRVLAIPTALADAEFERLMAEPWR